MAHEINNPLTIILGTSELMQRADIPAELEPRVHNIQNQAQRTSRIVRNLLSFARRGVADKEYMDVLPILEQALELKSHEFGISNIKVIRRWAPDLSYTSVDSHQLTEALVSMLNNAQQSMLEAREGGQLVMSTNVVGDSIRISMSDDGKGIPPENFSKIFDPFFTTKAVGERTGLGLSTCYGIVSQHGGTIWAESEPGQGATFHILLPILRRSRNDQPATVQPNEPPRAPRTSW